MKQPRRHHHLPESYQNGFCDGGRIWVFDRAIVKFRRDTPTNVAAIKDDYTIYRDGQKDTRIEGLLARVDGEAVPIIAKLRNREVLLPAEREAFSWYLASFVARVPRFRRWVNEQETARRKLYDREHLVSPSQIQELIERSNLPAEVRAEADAQLIYRMRKSEEYSVSLDHNSQVKTLVETTIELQPRLHDLNWVVAHTTEGSEFATSDHPLIEGLSGAFVMFPVARDAALVMLPTDSDKLVILHKDMTADMVHGMNVELAKACERLVLASKEEYLRLVVAEAGIEGTPAPPLVDIGKPPV
jgi:hypothetical protein